MALLACCVWVGFDGCMKVVVSSNGFVFITIFSVVGGGGGSEMVFNSF